MTSTHTAGIPAASRCARGGRARPAPRLALAVLALGLAGAALPAQAAKPIDQWRVSHEIEGYGERSLYLCLVAKRGLFGSSWVARREDDAGPDCAELIAFDPERETIYLAFPGALATAEYICSKGLSIPGRHPCKSGFFSLEGSSKERRRLDREALREAIDDAGGFKLAEQLLAEQREQSARLQAEQREQAARDAERQAREREQRRADCTRQLDEATALAAFDRVLAACEGQLDPGLRARASARRNQLEGAAREADLRAYRQAHAALGPDAALEALERFIARYAGDDPDQLVPRVRGLRDERLQRLQQARAERERQLRVAELIGEMESCRRQINEARALRAREQRVAAESGVEDPMARRRAAEIEFDCKARIDLQHREYRQLGGTMAREDFD